MHYTRVKVCNVLGYVAASAAEGSVTLHTYIEVVDEFLLFTRSHQKREEFFKKTTNIAPANK